MAWLLATISPFAAASTMAATITVNASSIEGVNPHYERDSAKILMPRGPADIALIKALGTRYERMFWRCQLTSGAEGVYDYTADSFSVGTRSLDQSASYGATPVISIFGTPAWLADTSFSNGSYDRHDPPKNMIKWRRMIYAGLVFWKTRYPNIKYIEVWNEPDAHWTVNPSLAAYEKVYAATARAMEQANARNLPGPALKIGGPGAYNLDATWITGLMDYAKANNLPLDFVSWHDYWHAYNPAAIQNDFAKVRSWLSARGMSAETLITEWSSSGNRENRDLPSVTRNAAYAAVANYYFYLSGNTHNFFFAQYNYAQPQNSLLDYGGRTDGAPDPQYSVYKMLSMMKSQVVWATSDGTALDGRGVGAWATSDGTGVSVLAWNYLGNAQRTRLKVNNLPSSFSGGFRVERYLMDETHSNFLYNRDKTLDKVADSTSSGASYGDTIALATNAVTLFVFTPRPARPSSSFRPDKSGRPIANRRRRS